MVESDLVEFASSLMFGGLEEFEEEEAVEKRREEREEGEAEWMEDECTMHALYPARCTLCVLCVSFVVNGR